MAWTTESGLVESYDGTVTRAWFGTDVRYMNGEVLLLNWEIKPDDPSQFSHLEDGVIEERFPCGKGWDSNDGGKSATHESGNANKRFHRSSIYGRIIDAVPSMPGLIDVLKDRGTEMEAKVWEGMRFHFARQEFDYGGEIGKKSRIMPVEFLGEAGEGEKPSNGASKVAALKAKAAAANKGNNDLRGQLVELAKNSDTHESFMDAALEVPGVADDDDLLAAVADENGLYAEARR